MAEITNTTNVIEKAVTEGGAYEVIRQRLTDQGRTFDSLVNEMNLARQKEFGTTEMKVLSRMRLRTENNCQAKDLVTVGDYVLFGYNVFIGLRKETHIEDVLSLYKLTKQGDEYELRSVALSESFLADPVFQKDFDELYAYYKDTALSQLVLKDGKLLVSFQIGKKITDVRVFRWQVSANGKSIDYIDNRGERDIQLPASHDFEWIPCSRDDVVDGRNPHINILDTLFVDSSRGDITIKVENNTNVGLGIYSEPVLEKNQALDDADFYFADLEQIILLKIKPFQEEKFRYLVFNRNNQSIQRIDAIGDACIQLPESHGIIFPGGYYLTTGEYKTFDDSLEGLVYKRALRSPNGEDVLYIFYQPTSNIIALYPYNLINKSLQNPLFGHGYGFYEDGRMIIFYADQEPNRVHPIQLWQTPYFSEVFASTLPAAKSFYGKIGNAEMVRGISELYAISRQVASSNVSVQHYHLLAKNCAKIFDGHYWLDSKELSSICQLIREIEKTSETVIDEYEKVESIRRQSATALSEAEATQQEIVRHVEPESWHSPQEYVDGLNRIRRQRGHLMTIREYRYISIEKIQLLDKKLQELEALLSQQTVMFLSSPASLSSYYEILEQIRHASENCETNNDLKPHLESLASLAQALDLISEMLSTLKVEDVTLQTQIVDRVSELYSQLNQCRAELEHQRKSFGGVEATAQFGARLKLLNQSIHNALGLSTTPNKCDEQVARLLVQLEELESEFSEFDGFINDIILKREEIFETFEEHKQHLLDDQQRKAQTLADAASRILQSVQRRVKHFTQQDELNTFFASDGLINKIRDIVTQLNGLDDSVKAEDIDAQLKAIKSQAIRSLRDKSDLYEADGQVIKLGPRHKFSVNRQELDLTILPKDGELFVRLTGTDYFEPLANEALTQLKAYWEMSIPSETPQLYRAEYLAYLVLKAAELNRTVDLQNNSHKDQLSWSQLTTASTDIKKLISLVSDFATPRYREGYEKGIHDHDAALILKKLMLSYESAGIFRFSPTARGLACIYWANQQAGEEQQLWLQSARTAKRMAGIFGDEKAKEILSADILEQLILFVNQYQLTNDLLVLKSASEYLVEELSQDHISFATSKYARRLCDEFKTYLETQNIWRDYQKSLDDLSGKIGKRWVMSSSWLSSFVRTQNLPHFRDFIDEAIGILNAEQRISRNDREIDLQFKVTGLLGDHAKIINRELDLQLDVFLATNRAHIETIIPMFENYQNLRQQVVGQQRKQLRLHEFKAKPLSSFVRNRLINEVYLPLIGDNLAKQMGTVGDKKRTDLMGLLLMISPPGYGKTTLMEYVADKLGLIFMKINCPVIGHSVTSVDPQQADNSASRQELEKLNLALEMGNNVMLYLDDIQHTNSEFLQKFISLCDGTRKIEGVWKNTTKTYDMRGKKFCVVMAGNPYTESGEAFQIPDMLANRADIYNLGDVLSGQEEVFGLSYIENSLTSNQVLAPLATRQMSDVYKFIDMANGKVVASTDLSHQYSNAEIKEIVAVLQKMQKVQAVVWRINKQYIAASSQDDKYRTEPTFKLQGSYRNMNKLAEKISAIMTDDELVRLIDDHYQGESQLLTTGTEANLLKLAEIRNCLNEQQALRWSEIKSDFLRNKMMGGDDADTGAKIVVQLHDLVKGVNDWRTNAVELEAKKSLSSETQSVNQVADAILRLSEKFEETKLSVPSIDNDDSIASLAHMLESSLFPMIRLMDGKLDLDLATHKKMTEINERLDLLTQQKSSKDNKADSANDVSKRSSKTNKEK